MFIASLSAGVANGIPFAKTILPEFFAAASRSPESSTSKLAFGSHQPPMPCFGVANDANGERGERYSLRKIRVTLSLKYDDRLTDSNVSLLEMGLLQSNGSVFTNPTSAGSSGTRAFGTPPFQSTTMSN